MRSRKTYKNVTSSARLKQKENIEKQVGPAINDGQDWTDEDIDQLLNLYLQGRSLMFIGSVALRPVSGLTRKIRRLAYRESEAEKTYKPKMRFNRTGMAWSTRDNYILKHAYADHSTEEVPIEWVATLLGRSSADVSNRLRLKKNKPGGFLKNAITKVSKAQLKKTIEGVKEQLPTSIQITGSQCCERDYDHDGNCDRHPPSKRSTDIKNHSGNKYIRTIHSAVNKTEKIEIDVYCVIKAFDVRSAPRQHAIKKLLCAGLRGKGDSIQDLKEAIDALHRDIEMEGQE